MKSAGEVFTFGPYTLEPGERRLTNGSGPVDLGARYFDALEMLIRADGSLVEKERFMDEVWKGIPVTDEALTQCIRTLRRALGDDAANPRYIETVPRHGYRFVAPVVAAQTTSVPAPRPAGGGGRGEMMRLGLHGVAGGALAGVAGGIFYGIGAGSSGETGSLSTVLVVTGVTVLVAALGAVGVAFGIEAGRTARSNARGWMVAGGAIGGMFEGGFVKLLGTDAFNLMFGRSPGAITGGLEGAALGAAVGIGAALAIRIRSLRRAVAAAAVVGGLFGMAISAFGGRLLGGSLALLAETMPGSRLRLDALGALAGEDRFGPVAQLLTATLEGMLFAGCMVAAMEIARRKMSS